MKEGGGGGGGDEETGKEFRFVDDFPFAILLVNAILIALRTLGNNVSGKFRWGWFREVDTSDVLAFCSIVRRRRLKTKFRPRTVLCCIF